MRNDELRHLRCVRWIFRHLRRDGHAVTHLHRLRLLGRHVRLVDAHRGAELHPLYWRYDILAALKAMAETGQLDDPRCKDALDLLASMQLDDGGWPAQAKFYTARPGLKPGNDLVDWGGTSQRQSNDWVTADALSVLAPAALVL